MAASRQRTSKKFQDRGVIIDDEHPWPAGLVRAEVVSGGRRSIDPQHLDIDLVAAARGTPASVSSAGRQAGTRAAAPALRKLEHLSGEV